MSQQDEPNKGQGTDGRYPNADPNAIATAMTVRDAAHAATVILHGSRARGDHRDRSDVNLILIHHRAPDQRIADAATATGDSEARRHYGTDDSGACPVEVSISWALPGDVQRGRNTINGIFARALDEGIAINRNWWETNYHRLEATHPTLYEPQITAKLLSECALPLDAGQHPGAAGGHRRTEAGPPRQPGAEAGAGGLDLIGRSPLPLEGDSLPPDDAGTGERRPDPGRAHRRGDRDVERRRPGRRSHRRRDPPLRAGNQGHHRSPGTAQPGRGKAARMDEAQPSVARDTGTKGRNAKSPMSKRRRSEYS